MEPTNRSFSAGFLTEVPVLLKAAGPNSAIANAAKLVGLASVANRRGDSDLIKRTAIRYGSLLRVLEKLLSQSPAIPGAEVLFVAVLLGIFEVNNLITIVKHRLIIYR